MNDTRSARRPVPTTRTARAAALRATFGSPTPDARTAALLARARVVLSGVR